MLTTLLDGRALSAGELAGVAGISLPTASGHLSRMVDAGLLCVERQGRHRYFRLSDADVAEALSALLTLAETRGHRPVRTGPKDAAMRQARSCYNHLAGEFGVRVYDSLRQRGLIVVTPSGLDLSPEGRAELLNLGVAVEGLKRPICRECLDWSVRRMHLSGPLANALLAFFLSAGWAQRDTGSRAIRFSNSGLLAFQAAFPLADQDVLERG